MVSLSNNNSNNINISANNQSSINVQSNTSSNVDANNNGNSQRAKSWAVGLGLIEGLDYSAKYWAEQSKESELTVTNIVEEFDEKVRLGLGAIETAESSAISEINETKTNAISEINSETSTQINNITLAGGEQITLILKAGAGQINDLTILGNNYIQTITILKNEVQTSANNALTYSNNAHIWAEGTDEEVQALGGVHSSKVWADLSSEGQAQADYTETDITAKSYIKNKPDLTVYATTADLTTGLSTKQDTISDLDEIRQGAELGASAVQPAALDNYVPQTQLATPEESGIAKLYDTTGENTDGAITQNAVTDKLNGKVSKTGDTMTGALEFNLENTENPIKINVDNNTYESADGTINYYQDISHFRNDTRITWMRGQQSVNGNTLHLTAVNPNDNTQISQITVGFSANGERYATMPATPALTDSSTKAATTSFVQNVSIAPWVRSWQDVATRQSLVNASATAASFSISSYLPNDGKQYLVLVTGILDTNSTAGTYGRLDVGSDIIPWVTLCRVRTRTASTMQAGGACWIPVGTGRTLTVRRDTSWNCTYSISCVGYRKIR